MSRQFLTLANQLTLVRLALIPFFVVAVLNRRYGWGLAVLLAAGLSDALDGLLARVLKQRTPLGAYLDPIADKLLLSTAFVILAIQGDVPWTVSVLVLGRDVLILAVALAIIIGAGWRPFPSSVYGKISTVTQVLTVGVVVLARVWPHGAVVWAKDVLIWLTVAITLASGIHYAWRTGKVLPDIPPKA